MTEIRNTRAPFLVLLDPGTISFCIFDSEIPEIDDTREGCDTLEGSESLETMIKQKLDECGLPGESPEGPGHERDQIEGWADVFETAAKRLRTALAGSGADL